MGRLTDDLMAMVGLKPSDRVALPSVTVSTTEGIALQPDISGSQHPQHDSSAVAEKKSIVMQENVAAQKESPSVGQQETTNSDCLSCKIIGTSTLSAGAGFILYHTWKNSRKFQGSKLVLFRLQGFCFSGGLLTLAVARFFDLSIFNKNRPKDATLVDLLRADVDGLSQVIQRSTPSGDKPDKT